MPIPQITTQQELDFILRDPNSPDILVFDVYADWCTPCKIIAPVMEELSKIYTAKTRIYKINIESGLKQDVSSLPTIEFWVRNDQGERVKVTNVVGANVPEIRSVLNKLNNSTQQTYSSVVRNEPQPKRQTGGYARACDLK
jgi:thioredoxin 1